MNGTAARASHRPLRWRSRAAVEPLRYRCRRRLRRRRLHNTFTAKAPIPVRLTLLATAEWWALGAALRRIPPHRGLRCRCRGGDLQHRRHRAEGFVPGKPARPPCAAPAGRGPPGCRRLQLARWHAGGRFGCRAPLNAGPPWHLCAGNADCRDFRKRRRAARHASDCSPCWRWRGRSMHARSGAACATTPQSRPPRRSPAPLRRARGGRRTRHGRRTCGATRRLQRHALQIEQTASRSIPRGTLPGSRSSCASPADAAGEAAHAGSGAWARRAWIVSTPSSVRRRGPTI